MMLKLKYYLTAAILLTLSACSNQLSNKVCFEKQCIDVEVVTKQEDVMRGLQERESLRKNSGMLFVFPKRGKHSFWMKDTWIPLDMIWLDASQRIIYIQNNVPPCKNDPCPSYGPDGDSFYVLEVNTGYVKELGLKVGDRAEFHIVDEAQS